MLVQDCYFFITEKKIVSPLCVPCHRTKYPSLGWFWEGSRKGYGPWLFKCSKCGTVIHDPETTEEDLLTSQEKTD